MNIRIELAAGLAPADKPVEVVERKGSGHPDTICDRMAEAVSRALCRSYYERCGAVLHHNVDKILLCGGETEPRFGGGRILTPIDVYVAGRAACEFEGAPIPVNEIAAEAIRGWLLSELPALVLGRNIRVHCLIRRGSAELTSLFAESVGGARLLANDTSIGAGFAPLSRLERTVGGLERALSSPEARKRFPFAGPDLKIMGIRQEDSIRLIVACAFIDRFVADMGDYLRKKSDLARWLEAEAARLAAGPAAVELNAADDPDRGAVFLTVTGTSAEAGDDGEVGRGNRLNGLITPGRPMTIEAASGKNPVTHTGRIYQVAAQRIAASLLEEPPGPVAAECVLVSEIGQPIEEPRLVSLRLQLGRGAPAPLDEARVRAVCVARLQELKTFWRSEAGLT